MAGKVQRDCDKCAFMIDKFCSDTELSTATLDLIHRLQAENAKQKAEIERLTEENGYLDMVAKQALTDYQNTQVQVDELTDKLGKVLSGIKADELLVAKGVEQAVKDTAKEIFGWLNEHLVPTPNGLQILTTYLTEHYGVEVE